MGAINIAMGVMMRATRINACGLPVEGPGNRIVTKGFVRAQFDPVYKERQELEQTTADNTVCGTFTTKATRKYYRVNIDFCGVDPELYSMYTGHPVIVDYAGKPIGVGDQPQVEDVYGVATEIWSRALSADDCPEPADDAELFSVQGSGENYGYWLVGGSEFTPTTGAIETNPTTFSVSGISRAMPHWLRGPYNVAGTDASGTPGRLLAAVPKDRHRTFFLTPVPPPAPTNGAASLAVQSIFTGKYSGDSALAVAPDQPTGAPLVLTPSTVSVTAATGAGQTRQVTVTQGGVDRTSAATWSVTDNTKATVVGGLVTGKAAGSTTGTVAYGGANATFAITVT